MQVKYTIAVDGVEALNNFQNSKQKMVTNTIPELLQQIAEIAAMRGVREFKGQTYRIYKGTITPGKSIVRHRIWTEKPIPTGNVTGITFDCVHIDDGIPPHGAIWSKGFPSVMEALNDIKDKCSSDRWRVLPIVGQLEFEVDNISVSLVE